MSVRNCPIRRKLGEQDAAFRVEAETVWITKVSRLPAGKSVEVWLTPNWRLALCRRPDSRKVGTYTKAVRKEDFLADCVFMLNGDH